MQRLLTIFLSLCCLSAIAQTEVKKVAILETVDKMGNVPYGVLLQVRSSLTYAISSNAGYEGYDRVDMSAITGEQNFQRTGMVSDEQIKRLGEMTGAAYVLIAEAALYDDQNIIIAAKILDVETGGVMSSTPPAVAPKDPMKMAEACIKCSQTLVGGKMPTRTTTTTTYSHTGYASQLTPAVNQDFTETAWGVNMKMIWVEGGDFLMGCTSEQSDCQSDEQNIRRVTVDGFYIGMLEVTQSQWEKVVGTSIYQQWTKADESGSPSRGVGPDYPMECVSWDEAMEFCRLLSNKTGRTYTLPTEAQWEYAARGGNKNEGAKYAGSNMIDAVAWYTDNSGGSTHIVGSKRANALGIYDMSGNVWEWCKDWYASSYVSYDTNNPVGPSSGFCRVLRGGCRGNTASACRVACRFSCSPDKRFGGIGFRVVCLP